MAELWFLKTVDGLLRPSSDDDTEKLKRFRAGDVIRAEVVRPRNGQHHRKAMALLKLVFENQERYETFEDLLVEFKLRTGHYQEHLTVKGKVVYIPKSIAFANMDQDEFSEWYGKAISCALKYFLPTMSRMELDEAIERILGFA